VKLVVIEETEEVRGGGGRFSWCFSHNLHPETKF